MKQVTPTFTPWLRRDQWTLFCSVYDDPDQLPASYDDWLRDAQDGALAFSQAGYQVHRVDVDVHRLISWCRRRRQRIDALALMQLAKERGAASDGPGE